MNNDLTRPAADDSAAGEERHDTVTRPTPSWFPQSLPEGRGERADHDRPRQPEPRPAAEPSGDALPRSRPAPRPVLPARETAARQRYYRSYPHEASLEDLLPRRRSGSMRATYVAAGVFAMLAGGATGFAFSHVNDIAAFAHQAIARLAPAAAGTPGLQVAVAGGGGIPRKLVTTATLDVADVSGDPNSLIPLMLHAAPAAGGQDIALRLSGLPKDAYLTAGNRTGDNDWMVALQDAEAVKLVVPRADVPKFDVSVAAVETRSGELAAPVKEMTVAIAGADAGITPTAAAPDRPNDLAVSAMTGEQPVITAAAAPGAAADLLQKGDQLLKAGDMVAARQFFERAFTLGAAEGALGVGKSYDPAVYAALGVQGLAADPPRAMEWYQRAAKAGQPEATAAIAALKATAP
jgi:hypothetical protein